MIQDSISKFYLNKENEQIKEDESYKINDLEDFSPDELEGDPEDITFEDHRKNSHLFGNNIHHQMQKMALTFSRISSTFEGNLTQIQDYVKQLQHSSKNSMDSFMKSSTDEPQTPKLESLSQLVSQLNSQLFQHLNEVDTDHRVWDKHQQMLDAFKTRSASKQKEANTQQQAKKEFNFQKWTQNKTKAAEPDGHRENNRANDAANVHQEICEPENKYKASVLDHDDNVQLLNQHRSKQQPDAKKTFPSNINLLRFNK